MAEFGLYCAILSVLWLNGNAQGHTIFLLVPQLFDWLLFFALATVLTLNLLRTELLASRSIPSRSFGGHG